MQAALATVTAALRAEFTAKGHWEGELSASALATATAVTALAGVDPVRHRELIAGGLRWLAENRNPDGGWGDTVRSRSNISTTALVWAGFGASSSEAEYAEVISRAEGWLAKASGGNGPTVEPERLARAIESRYGRDRTFSVPILLMCALAGRLGAEGWRLVPGLPFELAALPPRFYAALKLPVVSYALPALIALGQAIHHHAPSRNPIARTIRGAARARTLRRLEELQPTNGGFLEAIPLTSFVTMSLAAIGLGQHTVARRGTEFLVAAARPDGSWPIDTNLSTWVTTLAVKALAQQADGIPAGDGARLRDWLLRQQTRVVHPYTRAAPGAWAWTDLPGGVPDADDTAGALLALRALGLADERTRRAAQAGVRWLLDLQNGDGGIPTFCRGWGALPFDRSGADLTAHALRAWHAWRGELGPALERSTARAMARALRYLGKAQRSNGSWAPLWFGNEHLPDDENPLYGTAQVLGALREVGMGPALQEPAIRWMVAQQNADGGWGGALGAPSTIEETSLAVEALADERGEAVGRGVSWLVERVETAALGEAAPIGFYFAKLWYFEKLYPLIFAVRALGRVAREVKGGRLSEDFENGKVDR